jgi:hypothetical protein
MPIIDRIHEIQENPRVNGGIYLPGTDKYAIAALDKYWQSGDSVTIYYIGINKKHINFTEGFLTTHFSGLPALAANPVSYNRYVFLPNLIVGIAPRRVVEFRKRGFDYMIPELVRIVPGWHKGELRLKSSDHVDNTSWLEWQDRDWEVKLECKPHLNGKIMIGK